MWVTALYAGVLFLMGLCIAAAAPACNNPIFAEIVPPELRNMVCLSTQCCRNVLQLLRGVLTCMLATMQGFPAQLCKEVHKQHLQSSSTQREPFLLHTLLKPSRAV